LKPAPPGSGAPSFDYGSGLALAFPRAPPRPGGAEEEIASPKKTAGVSLKERRRPCFLSSRPPRPSNCRVDEGPGPLLCFPRVSPAIDHDG
jgi:hypothetical protein